MEYPSCSKETIDGSKLAIDLNRDNYEVEVLGSKEPVLVDFWGPQCKPCLALMPSVEKLEKEYAGRLKVTKVNAAENRMLCAKLRVMGLPSFLLYKDGVEMKRLSGEHITENDLIEAIKAAIAYE
jgi:thioredoxin 1